MRKLTLYIVLIAGLCLLHACSTPEQKQLKKIKALEKELYADKETMMDGEKAYTLVNYYVDYANANPANEKTAEYLFRAGDLSMNVGYPERALEIFTRIRREYPDYAKAPESLFLMAFIFENQLNDLQRAEYLYKQFIELYPNHELADDAAMLIEHLGKSPEELLKEFEERAKAQ